IVKSLDDSPSHALYAREASKTHDLRSGQWRCSKRMRILCMLLKYNAWIELATGGCIKPCIIRR
ncbi:hypothetical protein S245_034707, partial [Arachis hypogaea]